ncbi:MAG: phage tail protein [Rhodocyclaceae bacterium]|nr:phage tail protein [Rhodocyclaceae bacterium]
MADEIFPTAFYFLVRIGNSGIGKDASFLDVSGLGAEMETETYVEGGENRFVHRLPKGVKHQNLVLSRGLASTSSALVKWCRETLQGGLATAIVTKDLDVWLLDAGGRPLRTWAFTGAYPVKWQAESFNAMKNELAIEKIEFAFQSFTRGDD